LARADWVAAVRPRSSGGASRFVVTRRAPPGAVPSTRGPARSVIICHDDDARARQRRPLCARR
jgi:hypothetical protein